VLLECNGWGAAGGILSGNRHRTGDAIRGMEHLGKLAPPMGESEILSPWCYLAVRWILVWAIKPESVCITHARQSAPHLSNLRRV
jgi:hypothetical protein